MEPTLNDETGGGYLGGLDTKSFGFGIWFTKAGGPGGGMGKDLARA
jgi:hypothetical protein